MGLLWSIHSGATYWRLLTHHAGKLCLGPWLPACPSHLNAVHAEVHVQGRKHTLRKGPSFGRRSLKCYRENCHRKEKHHGSISIESSNHMASRALGVGELSISENLNLEMEQPPFFPVHVPHWVTFYGSPCSEYFQTRPYRNQSSHAPPVCTALASQTSSKAWCVQKWVGIHGDLRVFPCDSYQTMVIYWDLKFT